MSAIRLNKIKQDAIGSRLYLPCITFEVPKLAFRFKISVDTESFKSVDKIFESLHVRFRGAL